MAKRGDGPCCVSAKGLGKEEVGFTGQSGGVEWGMHIVKRGEV